MNNSSYMGKFQGKTGILKNQKRKFCSESNLLFENLSEGKPFYKLFDNIMA